MASAHPLPAPGEGQPRAPAAEGAAESSAEQALGAAAPAAEAEDSMALSAPAARLPVELDVMVPVPEFRVRNLLALEPGQVIETRWAAGDDLPLASGEVQLAWSEFEVIDGQLAVRVTQLA
jgi:flagellar motor switch/type III secretory pathway protein FliN